MSTSSVLSRSLSRSVGLFGALSSAVGRQAVRRSGSVPGRPRGKRRLWRTFKWAAGSAVVFTGAHYGWKYIKEATRPSFPGERKKVIILGTGWGALSIINHLEPGRFDVTVVSPRNYFLFTPLLPSVTVGTVESRSIVEPVRKLMLKHHKKDDRMRFLEAECVDFDPEKKIVYCKDKSAIVGDITDFELDYDVLVVAVGATTNTFGTPGVKEHCHFLKEVKDAQKIRNVIVDLVETASIPGQLENERKRLLHIMVVGGGPTGVEFAAEVHDFLREDVARMYPYVLEDARVTLVQSNDHILNTYDQQISHYTEEIFKMDQINVLTGSRVTGVSEREVAVMDKGTRVKESIPYGVCVWSTGVAPQPIARTIMRKTGQGKGRAILTDKFLRVNGGEGVFALGDCSTIEHELMMKQAEELFKQADINHDGNLSFDEFLALMETAKLKYPQVQVELSRAQHDCTKIFRAMDTSGDQRLDFEEFKEALRQIDHKLKSLPATAQVASQQGRYLARLLNKTDADITTQTADELTDTLKLDPFKYRHLGSFAYVGDNKAVLQVPIFGTLSGWWTMWLWRAAYANDCASARTKILVVGDWLKSYIFGRDSSRI